jgi:hypothetical protein
MPPKERPPKRKAGGSVSTGSPAVSSTLTPSVAAIKKKREGNCHWSDAKISSLVKQLIEAKALGLMSDSGFKKVV